MEVAAAPLPSSTAVANPRVSPQAVQKAVNSLLKWRSSKSQLQKPQLLDDEDFVYLILALKKIPAKDRINAYKVPLPHPLILAGDSSELCLVIDDRPGSGLTKDDAMKRIKEEGIPISKVLKFSKLKSDYRAFEAKRKLCDSYDLFLADKRVVPLLPRLLGKYFFKKRKVPVPVDLRHRNWKEQIERACGSAFLFLRTGTCCVVRVAKASMTAEEISENSMAAIDGIAAIVPRKWANVRSFHVKLLESVALPVYQSLPDLKLKIEGIKEKEEERETEEGDKKAGRKKKEKKGRIHEVRYMDASDGEASEDEDALGGIEDVSEGSEGEDGENEELGSRELIGKKRKKKGEVSNEKPSKKSAKVKEKDGGKRKKEGLSGKGEKQSGIETKTDHEEEVEEDDSIARAVKSRDAGGIKKKKERLGKLKN